jgi:exosortase A
MAVTGREFQSDAKPMGADPWPVAWSALLASVFGVTLIFSDTIAGMIQIWSNSDAFGHGFLIAPISAFLLWYGRDRLADISPRPCFWGLGAMIVALIAWLLGRLAGFLILENFAFVAVIQSLFLILLGWRAMRILAFPLFYLIVMVPFGEFLIPFLQDLTAILVVQALRIVDVPVFLDGVMLTIPTGAFEVAETCSGLRFMIAVVALGLIFAHLAYDDWLRKGIFMAIAICTTIVGNVLRAFGLVYLAHMTNLEVTDWADHITYGWVFLSFLLIILFWLGLKLRKNDLVYSNCVMSDSSRRSDVCLCRSAIPPPGHRTKCRAVYADPDSAMDSESRGEQTLETTVFGSGCRGADELPGEWPRR